MLRGIDIIRHMLPKKEGYDPLVENARSTNEIFGQGPLGWFDTSDRTFKLTIRYAGFHYRGSFTLPPGVDIDHGAFADA